MILYLVQSHLLAAGTVALGIRPPVLAVQAALAVARNTKVLLVRVTRHLHPPLRAATEV